MQPAQCVFSENTLFLEDSRYTSQADSTGRCGQSDKRLLRNRYFGLLAGCTNPGLLFARTPIKRQPAARREHDPENYAIAISAGAVWAEETDVEEDMKRVDQSARLIIADDHPLFRGALREAVSGLFDEVEIAEAGSFEDVAKLLERAGEVDLILLCLLYTF